MTILRPIETSRGNVVQPIGIYPGPNRIVLDASGSDDLGTTFATYSAHGVPHFTLDIRKRAVYQHLEPIGAAVLGRESQLQPHRRGLVIWACIAKHATEDLTASETKWVGETIAEIAKEVDVPLDNITDFPGVVNSKDKGVLMTWRAWLNFSGVASAAVVPDIARHGPGKFDREAFVQGIGEQQVVAELAEFPVFRGRPVKEGSKGKRVEHLQAIFGQEVTGTYDAELADTIREWKQERGLGFSSVVDSTVWKELEEFFTSPPE